MGVTAGTVQGYRKQRRKGAPAPQPASQLVSCTITHMALCSRGLWLVSCSVGMLLRIFTKCMQGTLDFYHTLGPTNDAALPAFWARAWLCGTVPHCLPPLDFTPHLVSDIAGRTKLCFGPIDNRWTVPPPQ